MLRALLVVSFVASLAACGGGGGGGGNGSGSVRSAETGVRLVHGAIDASPVQVFSSLIAARAVQSSRFGGTVPFSELPRGPQTIEIRRGQERLFASTVDVQKGQHYTVLFYESPSDLSPRFTQVVDPDVDVPDGMAAIRIGHAAIGAASITAFTSENLTVASRLGYGAFSEYGFVPALTARINYARDADGRVVHSTPVSLREGGTYTLVLSGEVDYFLTAPVLEDR